MNIKTISYCFLLCFGMVFAAQEEQALSQQELNRLFDEVIEQLPAQVKALITIIDEEYDKAPTHWVPRITKEDMVALHKALLQHYSPAQPEDIISSWKLGITTITRIYQEARTIIAKKAGTGIYTIDISEVIAQAHENPMALNNVLIKIESYDDHGIVVLEAAPVLDAQHFPRQSLTDIPGTAVAVFGIGGGSDCIQATQLASLLPDDKHVVALISIRTSKPMSAGASGTLDASRTITNAQQIIEGVYRVTPESTGSGRFFENLPAQEYPTYLIIDECDQELLTIRIAAALKDAGGADTIIAVDTGGDALYPLAQTGSVEQTHSTPDQDLRVLQTLENFLPTHAILTAEIAVGVDSPANAQEILEHAQARYYALSEEHAKRVIQRYKKWGMDGSHEGRYGKTSLTWQAAIQGSHGLYVLPLPEKVVVDAKNPWIPFVSIQAWQESSLCI